MFRNINDEIQRLRKDNDFLRAQRIRDARTIEELQKENTELVETIRAIKEGAIHDTIR